MIDFALLNREQREIIVNDWVKSGAYRQKKDKFKKILSNLLTCRLSNEELDRYMELLVEIKC